MFRDRFAWVQPWRRNYEAYAIIGWISFIPVAIYVAKNSDLPPGPYYFMVAFALYMALIRVPDSLALTKRMKKLSGVPLWLVDHANYRKIIDKTRTKGDYYWMGKGFEWNTEHAQSSMDALAMDIGAYSRKNSDKRKQGAPWIHGLNRKKDEDIYWPIADSTLHTLIVGTTGAGKTRFLDLLNYQIINNGNALVVIDPKGDHELAENLKIAVESYNERVEPGQERPFFYFHRSFPDESVSIDPLASFTSAGDLATRIAALMPGAGDGDPFQNFSQMALTNICGALLYINKKPSLVTIRTYLEGGVHPLLCDAIVAYATMCKGENWHSVIAEEWLKATSVEKKARTLSSYYYNHLAEDHPSPDLQGILTMLKHDSAHFGKMIASLLPVMGQLTNGPMAELLSPGFNKDNTAKQRTSLASIINQAGVVYIGLDSLSDYLTSSAVGSIMLADLTAVSGDRYNYGKTEHDVTLIVDEAAEVMNPQLIQILNKGRGSGMGVIMATQTISDLVMRLGSVDGARKVLGNVNNRFVLTTGDASTQEFLLETLPETTAISVQRGQTSSMSSDDDAHSGSLAERLTETAVSLFPQQLLSEIPKLEYFGVLYGGRKVKGVIPILTNQ